ncbi:hypothetical protein E9993_09455 [Labilibacter sediminis]|nr:hypothetical protein E9993_09455 [Labilibacter sediminis]
MTIAKHTNYIINLIIIHLLLLAKCGYTYGNTINVVSFTKDVYGAYSKNWSVDFDEEGNAYFGNSAGLLTFNGAHWQLYQLPNYGIVRSVHVASDGRIYVGSFEEFGYFKKDEYGLLHYHTLKEKIKDFSFHNNEVWKIYEDAKGNILFQSFDEIFIYKDGQVKILPTDDPILFLLEARGRYFAKSFYDDFLEFKNDSFTEIPQKTFKTGIPLRTISPFKENDFIIGSNKGLTIWNKDGFKTWDAPIQKEISDKDINVALFDGNLYYFGTLKGGIYVFDANGKIIHHLNTKNYLNTNTIYDIKLDKKKRLWYSGNAGVGYIEFNFPHIVVTDAKVNIGMVYSSTVFENTIYLATDQGVYSHPYNSIQLENIKLSDFKLIKGSNGQAWHIEAIENQLLCGHSKGTFLIEKNKFIKLTEKNAGYNFKHILVNNEKRLLLSTHYDLLVLKKNSSNRWEYEKALQGFNFGVKNIEVDHNNFIWASHFIKKSIYKLKIKASNTDEVVYEKYGVNKGLPSDFGNNVYKIFNSIVFATPKGFYAYDALKDTIISYSKLNGQLGKFSTSSHLYKGPSNSYWFINGSRIGYFKTDFDSLKKVFEYDFRKPGTGLVENYERIVPLENGQAIICLENGIAIYNPQNDSIKSNEFSYPIHINHIKRKNNKDQSKILLLQSGTEKLKHPIKQIEFQFSTMSSPGKNSLFQYKLEGLDENWSELSNKMNASYQKLRHGEYTLLIKGIDEYGKDIPMTSYAFEVLPPWYLRKLSLTIFILLWIAFFVSLPYGIKQYIKIHKRKLQEDQEKIIAEKEKEQHYKTEQAILQNKVEHQSSQLASSTMAIIRKNESLLEIKEEVEKKKRTLDGRLPDSYLDSVIKLIDRNLEHKSDWETFETHFDDAHINFFNRLKEKYPKLTPKDLRLCAYLKMNLSSKEIAPLLNISIRSVEVHRYRIRKKLELEPNDNLVEIMMQF